MDIELLCSMTLRLSILVDSIQGALDHDQSALMFPEHLLDLGLALGDLPFDALHCNE